MFIQKSDSEEQQKLFAAIYRRAKLLSNMVKLSPNSLNLEDIANFIELFGGASTLKTELITLDQSCKDLQLALNGADDYEADYHNGFNQRRNSCYLYQALDVSYIQNEMIQTYLGKFTIHEPIGDDGVIDQALNELLISVNGDKPTLCVYNLGDSHWVTFAAIKKDGGIVILYKDSLGASNQVFKEKIKGLSTGSKLTFITNNRKEQTSGVDCGIFALKNMEIMASSLIDNKDSFIQEFQNFQNFCSLEDAKELRKGDFAGKYVLGLYNQMSSQNPNIEVNVNELLESLYVTYDYSAEICKLVENAIPGAKLVGADNLKQLQKDKKEKLDKKSTARNSLGKDISNLENRLQRLKVVNIDNLIVLLAEKLTANSSIDKKILPGIIDKLIETGKSTNDKVVALAVLNILNFVGPQILSKENELNGVFDNILSKFSQDDKENINLIKNLAESLPYHSSLIDFMHNILIKSKNPEARMKFMELLESSAQKFPTQLSNSIKRTIDLENCTRDIDFKELLKTDRNKRLIDLLEQIATENEKIPELFTQNFKKLAKSFDYKQEEGKSELIRTSKLMLKDGYISLGDIGDVTQLLDDKTICQDILKIIRDEFANKRSIEDKIFKKVKELAYKEKGAGAIITAIERCSNTAIGILSNPRETLEKRSEALDKIRTDNSNHSPYVLNILESVIKFDDDLQGEAFKVLVSILPDNYSKKGFAIDLEEIAKNIYNASIDEILTLARKDKTVDLSAIGALLIERIVYGDNSAIEGLKEISSFNQGQQLALNNLRSLLFLVHNAVDPVFKKDVIEIIGNNPAVHEEIKKYIPIDDWEKIKNGQELVLEINSQSLGELKKEIEQGRIITKDIVSRLIASLSENKDASHYAGVADILFQIDLSQEIDDKTGIYEAAVSNDNLRKLPSIVGLIANDIYNGAKVPEEIKSLLLSLSFENIDDKNLKHNLIIALRGLVLQGNRLNPQVLEQISNYLGKKEEDINLRMAIADIIAKEIKRENNPSNVRQSIIEQLQNVCLEDRKNEKDDLLNKIAFQALEPLAKINKLSQAFLSEYYNKFKERTLSFKQEDKKTDYLQQLKPLKDNISSDKNASSNSQLFYLLSNLNNTFLKRGEVDATIFSEYSSSTWRKELLSSELLAGIFKSNNIEEGVNEFELQDFTYNLNSCSEYITKHSNIFNNYSIENVLQKLIDYSFSLEDVNDILVMLQSGAEATEALDIIQNDSLDFVRELKKLWLRNVLNDHSIKFTTEDLTELSQCLPYRVGTINDVMSKIESNVSIKDLTNFFTKLGESRLDIEEKNKFLSTEIKNNSSPKDWLPRLNYTIACNLLNQKFSSEEKISINKSLLERIQIKLGNLLNSGWLVSSLSQLIEIVNKDNIEHMLDALDPIYEYNLREYETDINGKELLTIFKEGKAVSANWSKQVHDLAIFQTFKGSNKKDLEQLKKEILELNDSSAISILQNDKFISDYNKVIETFSQKSHICSEFDIIANWTEENIKAWADKIKASPNSATQYEKIAVVKRAVELNSKFPPREIQLLSVLIMLNPEEGKGRLAQNNTGEGKTTIVAMLAAIKALEGHKVDIITSSSELAKPQAEDQEKFFKIFSLTAAHNGKEGEDIKERYKADIIYGAAGDFQGDILRDEYSKLGTRSGRICDVAIVDEVDSMLIDGKNNIVMLSSPMPAMDHLEPLLAAIWVQIGEVAKCIREINGKAFFVAQEPIIGDDGKILADITEKAYLI